VTEVRRGPDPDATADRMVHRVPLIVVGAGVAGVAAASAAVGAHVPVVLVDAAERPGGRHHRREPMAFRTQDPGALDSGWEHWRDLLGALERSPRLTLLTRTSILAARRLPDGAFELTTDRDDLPVRASDGGAAATGATDRIVPFPGWDLPGVMTLGAAGALIAGQGIRPGHQVVISGSGPLLLPTAADLARVGTGIVALADAGDPTSWLRQSAGTGPSGLTAAGMVEGAEQLATLARQRVRLRSRTAAVEARGLGRVEEVVLMRLDDAWHPVAGTEEVLGADALVTSHGVVPDISLVVSLGASIDVDDPVLPRVRIDAMQATGVAGLWAAGELTGAGGPEVAEHEGLLAGLAAARAIGGRVPEVDLERAVARRRADAPAVRRLDRSMRVPAGALTWMRPDTLVCRCEEVRLDQVDAAISHRDASDLASLQHTTRCGMGRCQGRICAPTLAQVIEDRTGRTPADAGAFERRAVLRPMRFRDV